MVDTRRRNRNPYDDDNGYGDAPARGAVGFRGEGRQYPGGYGKGSDGFAGGPVDDGRSAPSDDEGFDPGYSRYGSGLGALGSRDPGDAELGSGRDEGRPSQDSHRGRGPRGYRRSDERVHEDVCDRLTEDPFIDASEIEVRVKDGEVTLDGSVSSRGLKRRAEDLAEMASGVAQVQNNLRVQGA
jgi:BON domain